MNRAPADSPRFAIATIFFHPPEQVREKYARLSREQSAVWVYDNTPGRTAPDGPSANGIHDLGCGQNVGIGSALRQLAQAVEAQGYDYLLYFDQDTEFSAQTLKYLQDKVCAHRDLVRRYSVISLSGKRFSHEPLYDILDRHVVISSGSVFNLQALKAIGWHDPSYFVDGVDYKLCLDSLNKDFKVGLWREAPGFDHASGQTAQHQIRAFGHSRRIKIYSLRRAMGVTASHLRLIACAAISFRPAFALTIFRLLIGFWAQQLRDIVLRLAAAPERNVKIDG